MNTSQQPPSSDNNFIDFTSEKPHQSDSSESNTNHAEPSMPFDTGARELGAPEFSLGQQPQVASAQSIASEPLAQSAGAPQAAGANSKAKTEESIRINLSKIEEIQNIFGEQIILQSALEHYLAQDPIDMHQSEKILSQLRKLSVSLQNLIISLRMVPVSSVLGRLSRAVRDVATSTDKLVEIKLEGGDNEIDKNILEQLIDPLVHMVRNSVDHGIEMPEERKQKNKSPSGTVKISARRLGSNFEIKISDDGKGLSKERILEKAHSSGIVQRGFVPETKDIFKLIFASGFSTKASTTEFSGRGVGMDVVQQQVKSLKGTIDIDSVDGSGSTFTIKIPLSLAIFNGTVVKIGEDKYVIPNTDYRETISLDANKNRRSSDQKGTIVEFNKELMRLVDLRDRLGNKFTKKPDMRNIALVVEHENQKFACIVSDILYQEQIVLKEMGPETKLVKEATGGTILGDGKVALIIDLLKIIASKGIAA
ncbi:MAG: chemotaxis protein CheA [Pseudomonadota bacterium]